MCALQQCCPPTPRWPTGALHSGPDCRDASWASLACACCPSALVRCTLNLPARMFPSLCSARRPAELLAQTPGRWLCCWSPMKPASIACALQGERFVVNLDSSDDYQCTAHTSAQHLNRTLPALLACRHAVHCEPGPLVHSALPGRQAAHRWALLSGEFRRCTDARLELVRLFG